MTVLNDQIIDKHRRYRRTGDSGLLQLARRFVGLLQGATMMMIVGGWWGSTVMGQIDPAPVYTDDSPEAWEILGRAKDQIERDNVSEAVRLYQRLLDDFGSRLVSKSRLIDGAGNQDNQGDQVGGMGGAAVTDGLLISVRERVHRTILADADLLRSYREINEAAASRLLEQGSYERVFLTRFLTSSGLETSLGLVEEKIRRAQFASALLILREIETHPDFKREANNFERWSRLLALAGLYTGDRGAWDRGIDELGKITGGEEDAKALRRLEEEGAWKRLDEQRVVVATDELEADPSLAEIRTKPVWRYSFGSGPANALAEKTLSPTQRDGIRKSAASGQFANFVPTVCDDVILASDGISIAAVDRFDGRQRWRYPVGDQLRAWEKTQLRERGPDADAPADLSMTASNGRDALAVIYESAMAAYGRRQSNRIVCMDVESGDLRWSVRPSDISEALSEATFTGPLILSEGRVVATLRLTRQRLASEYLVSLNLATGKAEWSRFLVSSPVSRSFMTIPPTMPIVHRGVIYLSSPLGCVTAVNGETGHAIWEFLEFPQLDLMRFSIRVERPWETSSPIWTPAGLLADSPDRESTLVIAPSTGEILTEFVRNAAVETGYLLFDGEAAYFASNRIYRISLDRLEELAKGNGGGDTAKTYSLTKEWSEIFVPGAGERILGRVSVGRGRLIASTTKSVLLVDSTTGEVLAQAAFASQGSPLVIGAEVLFATDEGIDSYMPYSLAEPRLRARIASDLSDAAPAISLARLAGRHHQFEDILPAVDQAIDALNQSPFSVRSRQAQDQLFRTLIELADDPVLAKEEGIGRRRKSGPGQLNGRTRNTIAEDLFVRLDLISTSVEQRLEYLFTFGGFQTREGRPEGAVDAYQQILSTASLSSGFYEEGDRQLRADLEATSRLRRLVLANGASIYALYDEAARKAYEEAGSSATYATLLELAHQYPFSNSAVKACLRAGIMRFESERPAGSLRAWRFGLGLIPTVQERGQLLGELVSALEVDGRIDEVLYELRAAERTGREVTVETSDGKMLSTEDWRREFLARIGASRRLPRVGDFDEVPGRIVEGDELLLPLIGRPSSTTVLVRRGRAITAYGGPNLQPTWNIEIDRAETDLLEVDGENAILWGQERRFPLNVQQISLVDGSTVWNTNIWSGANEEAEGAPNRQFGRGGRRIGRIDPAVGLDSVIFTIVSGDVVCVDRFTGKIRWMRKEVLPEISQAVVDSFGVVIGGQSDIDDLEHSPVVLVLDLQTGSTISEFEVESESPIRWLLTDSQGYAALATQDTVIGIDLQSRQIRWRLDGVLAALGDEPQLADRLIYVTNADARLQAIDIASGSSIPLPTLNLETASTTPIRTYSWDGRTLLKSSTGVYIFDIDGQRASELARSGSSDLSISGIAIGRDRAIVLETTESLRQRSRKQLILYGIDPTGRRIDRGIQPNSPLPKIDSAQAVTDWVVVDAGSNILMFHAPASGTERTGNGP